MELLLILALAVFGGLIRRATSSDVQKLFKYALLVVLIAFISALAFMGFIILLIR